MKKDNLIKLSLVLVAIVVVIFGAMKIFDSFSAAGNAVQDIAKQTGEFKEFNIKAFRFGYTPNEIIINKGDRVKINIESTDTLHGIRIPELNINGNDIIEFVANEKGEFIWYCNNMCGVEHKNMNGKLIVK